MSETFDPETPPERPARDESPEGRARRRLVALMQEEQQETRNEITALKASSVRWDRLIFLLGSAATVIVGASWKVMKDNLERSDRVHATEMRAVREDVARMLPYVIGTYQAGVESKPKAQVAQEVRAAVQDGGR